jgi:hypothetical protein
VDEKLAGDVRQFAGRWDAEAQKALRGMRENAVRDLEMQSLALRKEWDEKITAHLKSLEKREALERMDFEQFDARMRKLEEGILFLRRIVDGAGSEQKKLDGQK